MLGSFTASAFVFLLAALSATSGNAGETNCWNPLFRMHWANSACRESCPSRMNRHPRSFSNLTVCAHWQGIDQCCNPGLEKSQIAAFDHWKSIFGQTLGAMRTYLAQMKMRKITSLYDSSSAEAKTSFNAAADKLHSASHIYPKCMSALLQYAAGSICFMCDPQWAQFMYKQGSVRVQFVYSAAQQYRSISIAESACEQLWQACQGFAKAAKDAWRIILECPLAKEIYAPLPDIGNYFSKPKLCSWARESIALLPMPEASPTTLKPTMPALPPDALTTSVQPISTPKSDAVAPPPPFVASRLLTEPVQTDSRADGLTYVAVALHHPNEVKVGEAPRHGALRLSLTLGGDELGSVRQMAIDDGARSRFIYFAVSATTTSDEAIQYKYTTINGKAVIQAPATVWPAGKGDTMIIKMRVYEGSLYLATSDNTIFRVRQELLKSGTRSDGEALYKISGRSGQSVLTGIAVRGDVYWSTANEVFAAPRDGPAHGERRQVLSNAELVRMTGNGTTIQDLELAANGTIAYIAVHAGGVSQVASVYWFHTVGAPNPVKLLWNAFESKLFLSLGPDCLFISSGLVVRKAPSPFVSTDTAKEVFAFPLSSTQKISDIALFFVPGSDCVVSDWQPVGSCSATCGNGTIQQEREVVSLPENGGLECPTDLRRHAVCHGPPCPQNLVNCLMGQWMNDGACSKTCDQGEIVQRRSILRKPSNGGLACPDDVRRAVPCNIANCGGLDYVVAATKVPGGLFAAQVEGVDGQLTMNKVAAGELQEAPDIIAVDSANKLAYVASSSKTCLRQWAVSISEDNMLSLYSPRTIWGSLAKATGPTVLDIALVEGDLYMLISNTHASIIKLPRASLTDRNLRTIASKTLYSGAQKHLEQVERLSTAGTYLAWVSPLRVTLGNTAGMSQGIYLEEIVTPNYFHTVTGSSAAKIVDAELTTDGHRLFMLLWDSESGALGLYSEVVHELMSNKPRPKQLRYTWGHSGFRLVMSPYQVYVYDSRHIWTVPLDISKDTFPTEIYNPQTDTQLSAITFLFVKGTDCSVTDWKSTTDCSKSCGGGTVTQTRTIIHQALRGGSACPSDLVRHLQCNVQACPVHCKVTEWRTVGNCSQPCDGGIITEVRKIVQQASYGGDPCPQSVERQVACNTHPCHGTDCRVSDWINDGSCTRKCGAGLQKQYRVVRTHATFGGIPCSTFSYTRQVVCNPTPCQQEGFDPIAAGKLSGFNFDVAEYCDHPDLCAVLQATAIRDVHQPPPSASTQPSLCCLALLILLCSNIPM